MHLFRYFEQVSSVVGWLCLQAGIIVVASISHQFIERAFHLFLLQFNVSEDVQ